jgi:hypothetical protein
MGILCCSNKGSGPLQRGDNHKKCKNGVDSFKNLLQNHCARIDHIYMTAFWYNLDLELFTSWSPWVGRGHDRENHIYIHMYVYIKKKNPLLQNQPANFNRTWYKSSLGNGILSCSNKGPCPLQRGDNHKNGVGSFKNFLQNHWATIYHIYMTAFWYNIDSELFTWSLRVGRGHNRENYIYICLYWKKIVSCRTSMPMSIQLGANHPRVKGILNCTNKGPRSTSKGR